MLKQRTLEVEKIQVPQDFSKMRIGQKSIDDAIINVGNYSKINANYGNKAYVMDALYRQKSNELREISKFYYRTSGIYYRLCRYLAFLYRYDWYVTPYVVDLSKEKEEKILSDFAKVLNYLDNSQIKHLCNNIALTVIKEGAYYGIMIDFGDRFGIQQLPTEYCRCRFTTGITPVVELNLRFFDVYFTNPQYKIQVLKTFPKEIQQGYILFRQGKLKGDYPGDKSCWMPLDSSTSVRITLNDDSFPALVGVIPSIIDLDEAQELDRKKTMQQLLKIIIQKLPLDKNGDLVFDVDEAKDIHNNAVAMLKRAVGVDVLTTFADIDVANMRDSDSTTTTDDLEKVERTVFNNSGISRNLFNADGNLATTNSILTDESNIRDLFLQIQALLNRAVAKFNRKNHYSFTVNVLETTQYNYKDLAKLYKEHTQLGFQKVLPQIALGHSQSSILAGLTFENEVLHLAQIMVPPMSSNTMSSTALQSASSGEAGRPEKEENEKSDKTIQNTESAS